MMWTGRRIAAVLFVMVVVFVAPAAYAEYFPAAEFQDPNEPEYVEGELLVRFAPKIDRTIPTKLERRAVLTALDDARETGSYWLVPGLTVVKLPPGLTVAKALDRFNARTEILYAQPNWLLKPLYTPDDEKFPDQWALNNTGQTGGTTGADVNAPEAWDLAMGTREIVVAVIDTGIDYTHPDLARNMWVNQEEIPENGLDDDENGFIDDVYGYNMIGSRPNDVASGIPVPDPNLTGDPMDDNGHGTHCAGIIAAVTDNAGGVAGVCPNVRIMALKFLPNIGGGPTSDAISCIQYAVNNGANIMSNSWGGGEDNQSLEAAIQAAEDANLIFVAAAGNNAKDNDQYPFYPAGHDCNNIIAVLSTDHNDVISYFSNYGPNTVDIGAPGTSIVSTLHYGRYAKFSGTSMACPLVAGACALVWSLNPSLDWSDVKDIIMDSVDDVNSLEGKCVSEGRLNVHRAILNVPESGRFLTLDRQYYCDADEIRIVFGDSNLAGSEPLDVNVVTTDGNDLNDVETVSLIETPADSGLFIGAVPTSPNSVTVDSNYLELRHDQTITVTYHDPNDTAYDANDTATADCNAPVISDVNVTNVYSVTAIIAFDTPKPAFARVSCANDVNGPFDIIGEGAATTKHTVMVRGLSPETTYYCQIEAYDLAANYSADTNDANYYSFTTVSGISIPDAYNSVQQAIDAVPAFETIIIEPNTYYGAFKFNGKPLTITGTDPTNWHVVESTIIDANGAEEGILFDSPFRLPGAGPSVRGLTVRNAEIGIQTWSKSLKIAVHGPVVTNCLVENCTHGIRTWITAFDGDTSNNKIRGNDDGLLVIAAGVVTNNSIYANTNGIRGFLTHMCEFTNNTIVGNSVGISDHSIPTSTEPLITNCIFWANDASDLESCSATYSCIEDYDTNDANFVDCITTDPCFLNIFDFVDKTTANDTNTALIVADANIYDVNDVIEYDNDGVPRTLSDVNTTTAILTFSPALDANSQANTLIYNWGPAVTDVNEDFHLDPNSLCIDAADPNRDYTGQRDIDGAHRDVNSPDIGADEQDCFPRAYTTHADWVRLARPDCWCQAAYGSGYQCDGDADGATQDPNNYRVYTLDLDVINANWMKKIDDEDLDPCADIDHKPENPFAKYRVYIQDLNKVIANWKLTDADLDGDCPTPE